MSIRFAPPTNQILKNGAPLSRGQLYFYTANTTSAKDTYTTRSLSVANTNPVVLTQEGYYPDVFLDGSYRVILKDADGVQIWDRDYVNDTISGVSIENSPIGSGTPSTAQFTDVVVTGTSQPGVWLNDSDAGSGDKYIKVFNDSGYNIATTNDAKSITNYIFRATTSGGVVTAIELGNSGDTPPVTIYGLFYQTVTTGITAGSTQTQAGATTLTTQYNIVTVVGTNGDGVELPAAASGLSIWVRNADSAQTLQVWPNSSDTIDGGAADAVDANQIAAGAGRLYVADGATNWATISG